MSPEKFVAGAKSRSPEGDRNDSRNKTKGKNRNKGEEKFLKKKPKNPRKLKSSGKPKRHAINTPN